MRVLITTGLSDRDIGGPFQYAPRLRDEFEKLGHKVKVVSYDSVEKFLPVGLRHLYFFLKILPTCLWADYVLTLDTFSVGVPTVLAAKICGKKSIVRVGGDSLWSAYVNRISEPLTLSEFYRTIPKLNLKERMISSWMRNLTRRADFLAFNTEWQRSIWQQTYDISNVKSGVVRNFISEKREGKVPKTKNFLWAGRLIPEKNPGMLKRLGIDIVTGESHNQVLDKVKSCYAAVSFAFSDICPNFIIEAISFNKPFIMTKETGLNELYPIGGVFVDPLDENGLELAIQAMLEDNTYNKHVEELKSINLSHSWGEMAREFLDIWKNL